MRHLTRFRALGALGLACMTALAGCGTDRGDVLPAVTGALASLVAPDAPQPDLRAQLTPQVLASIDGPLIIVEVPSAPSQAGLAVAGTNGPYVTWAAENSTLVITNRGVVTGTRGLGFDLMNAEVSGTIRAIADGGGAATRTHRYLDGTGAVLAREFECALATTGHDTVRLVSATLEAVRITETCKGALGGVFENTYWVAGAGEIVKSTQWISPRVGYINIERAK